MVNEYNSLKEIERDLKTWFQYKDYLVQNQRQFNTKYWEWAIAESDRKIRYLHTARDQRINAGQL
jgi:hypothetical protein